VYIQGIELKNFRNYSILDVEFSRNMNIIYGFNGQGKTNILEAIYLCASGRSHRTSKDIEMIKFNEDNYLVKIDVKKDADSSVIEIIYEKNRKKRIRINEIPAKKIGDLMGRLNAVMFSPEDLMIIKEGPSERRRFLDITISQLKPAYFYDLQQYYRVLFQRNNLLKELQEKRNLIDTLDIWNENLAKVGSRIIKRRYDFIERLSSYAHKNHLILTNGLEELNIKYNSTIKINGIKSREEIEKAFIYTIELLQNREIQKGMTLCGPQRDDYEIFLDGKNIKLYGSQGQQRTAILSVKLSEIDIMKEETDEYPVLLLDDVLSELDAKRQEYLFNNLQKIQAFITCTDKNFFESKLKSNYSYYYVNNGEIIEKLI
jgi:DNA replication and repair protein RecF